MAFLDTIGDIGEALSGIPYGIDKGLAPFKTWEGVRTADLQNDLRDISNRNALLEQQAREGMEVPSYYGDFTQSKQTGFQDTTAKNLLDIFNQQQALAMRQYGASPQGQAEFVGMVPGSPEYAAAQAAIQGRFDPFGAGAFGVSTLNPLRNQAATEQVAAQYGSNVLASMYGLDPSEIQLQRGPNGEWMATAFGEQLQIPREALITMAGMSGIKGPSEFRDTQLRNIQAVNTANANNFTNIYKALVQDEMRNDPQLNAALNTASKQVEDFGKAVQVLRANPLADPAEITAAEQRFSQAYANYNQIQQLALRRGVQRYGGGVPAQYGGGMQQTGFRVPTTSLFGPAGAQPGAVRQPIRFGPTGARTQVIAGVPSQYGLNIR